ncbi:MAG: UvrD-helicase domain-containing protein, partial [Alistipes sp.]|nr:UvrD-helicase domain-containing protein [Alistipes sp.]
MRAIILNASAGSGKTYTLAYNYVRDVIREPMLYRHILAVTFTNKATEEMKSRILKEIHLLSECKESNYLEDLCRELALDEDEVRSRAKRVQGLILHDYSHFTILTIDKFFQRVLHAFLKELGIELNFNVELESAPTLTRSVDSLIERIASDSKLKEWLSHYSEERMNESEGWDLRDDIIKLGGELFKESYHSSLKNRASRDEIDRLHEEFSEQYDTSRTEFQEIAVEAVKLISDNHLSLNDFSYKNSGAAAYFYTIASGKIDEPKARVRECALSGEKLMTKDNAKRYATLLGELQELMARLCDYYDTHIEEWNTTLLFKEHYRTFALLSDIYDEAQRIWRNENTLLLSETKNILSKFIEGNDAPFIYEKVGNRYDRYLIDEFQD